MQEGDLSRPSAGVSVTKLQTIAFKVVRVIPRNSDLKYRALEKLALEQP